MASLEDIEWARKTLGLSSTVKLADVKSAYRSLAKKHHPDKKGDAEKMVAISKANKIIVEYIENYTYSLKLEDVRNQDPDYRFMEMYQNDPMWGRKTEEKNR